MDLIINMRNGIHITKLTFNFLSNCAITGFSTRSSDIFIRNIVTINMGRFNLMLTVGLNQIFG